MPIIMDQRMKDYLRTAPAKPAPTQESLTNVFRHVTRVRIFAYNRRGEIKTISLVQQDPQALRELQVALRIHNGQAGHCMCVGDPQLLLEKDVAAADETTTTTTHELARISVHHGWGIRWNEAWCSDAGLINGVKILEWLDKHGYPKPLEEYHNEQERYRRQAQDDRRWKEATPECLRNANLHCIRNDELLAQKLQTGMPDPLQRCRALFEWYGSGAGPWSGFPSHEAMALKLLEQESISVMVDSANSQPQATALLEGAARFFSMTEHTQVPPLDNGLKACLREHVLSTGRRDNLARFNARFGPVVAPEGCLKLIQTDWSTLDITAVDDDGFYTFPEGAWFVPYHAADTFLGWIERFAWWDTALVIRAAAIALRLVMDTLEESFSWNDQDRRDIELAISTTQDWLACPCERHEKAAQKVERTVRRGTKPLQDRHATDYLTSSASSLVWAAEGCNHFRATSSVDYTRTALASLCAGLPEKASHFESFYMEDDDDEDGNDNARQNLREAEMLLTRQIRDAMEPLIQQKLASRS